MSAVAQAWTLGKRALREATRTPDSTIPTVFIPLFFLVVNVGQAGKIFPSKGTGFLNGQTYAGFQMPSSLLLAASFGSAALYLVEDIEGGYFDKLRATPISRTAIVLGRLTAEAAKGLIISLAIIAISLLFGVKVKTGPLGWVLLVVLAASWGVVFAGFMQIIALKTRSAAATQSASLIFFPLLFLTPSFAPRDLLTRPMEIAASFNPVTYVMEGLRGLVLKDSIDWGQVGTGFAVVAVLGALMIIASVKTIRSYD
jgi:ABC-2 type transport system permease protein